MKKYLIGILLTAVSFSAMSNSITYDPNLEGDKTMVVTCVYPTEREDNTALAMTDIASINFYVDTAGTRTEAGTNTTACSQTYNLTSAIADGVYEYVAVTIDTDGRPSVDSLDKVILTVKRTSNPKSPGGLTGSKN